MYKLLYPSIRVRTGWTAPPVSVRVRTRVSVSFSFTVLHVFRARTFAIADMNRTKTASVLSHTLVRQLGVVE